MSIPVPSQADHLSAEWLTKVLAEAGYGGANVTALETERIGEGVGFIGQLHRLHVDYASSETDAPRSLIAKMPTNDPGGRLMGSLMRLYEKESGFYRHLAADCPVAVPRCFYNGVEPEEGNYCLLLEDLNQHEPGNQIRPRTMDETREMLSIMARIHAKWCGRAQEHHWLPAIDDQSSLVILSMFEEAYPVAMERYSDVIPAHMHDWGPRFAPTAAAWVADFAAQPGTIIHGDYRTDNFMFAPDGAPTLLDWQLTCRAPGAYDVYYFLAMCPEADAASAILDELLQHYLDEYAAAGGTPPDMATLLHQMRGVGLWLTTLGCVTMAQLDPANPRGEELFLSMWQRGVTLAETIDLSPLVP